MTDPKTVIGNIRITSIHETPKVEGHPWTYPYSGYGLGNSLRNCYAYSQYGSQMILSYDWPTRMMAGDKGWQTKQGFFSNSYRRFIRTSFTNFSPWTHLGVEFIYQTNQAIDLIDGDRLIFELTGAVTEVVSASLADRKNLPPSDIISPGESLRRVSYDLSPHIRERFLIPVSGNYLLTGSVTMNGYFVGSNQFTYVRPVSITIVGENHPVQGG